MRSANSSLEFLRRISRRRRSAQHGVESISEYVERRAALLTPENLAELRTDLPLLQVLPEIGYADDSLIVRTVLSQHQDIFRDYCHFRKIRWSKLSLGRIIGS
jgi:hypothetical protein